MGDESLQQKSKKVMIGEIFSLVALLVVLILFILYFSSDSFEVNIRDVGTSTPEDNLRQKEAVLTNKTMEAVSGFEEYLARNRKAIVISGLVVASLVIVVLGVLLLAFVHRKRLFNYQNSQSQERIAAYQKTLQPVQKP